MLASLRTDRSAPGELFIWTDIDPVFEEDFNRWYDREHMAERAAIQGFEWSRRYVALDGERKYLALYRTRALDVFLSPAYQRAFENQTPWSVANFGRMRNTQRRVMAVAMLAGAGTGAVLLLARLGTREAASALASGAAAWHEEQEGLLALRMLVPDPELSTPLSSEQARDRVLEPILLADLSTVQAATQFSQTLSQAGGLGPQAVSMYSLLWDLRSADLGPVPA